MSVEDNRYLYNNLHRAMKKDFDWWNEKKKQTQDEHPRLYTVREIWWCRLEAKIGFLDEALFANLRKAARTLF